MKLARFLHLSYTRTEHYGFKKPVPGSKHSGGKWGKQLNVDLDRIDRILHRIEERQKSLRGRG